MAKFKPFISPTQVLAQLIRPFGSIHRFYQRVNRFDDSPRFEPRIHPLKKHRYYALGGFNPVLAMKKDFVDTFKPYYSGFYVVRDLLQPVRGFGNIIKGVFIFLAPILFVVSTVYGVIKKIVSKSNNPFSLSAHMKMNLAMTVGGFLHGITSLVRGTTQILATAFLPLRLISRSICSCFSDTSVAGRLKSRAQKMEALINKDKKTFDDAVKIDNAKIGFYNKVLRGDFRNEIVGLTQSECKKAFEEAGDFVTLERDENLKKDVYQITDSLDTRLKTSAFFNLFADYENMSTPLIPPGRSSPEEHLPHLPYSTL